MRRIATILILLATTGCFDALDSRYLNPDKTTTVTVDKLFTGMLANHRVWPMYWEISTFVNWHIGIYAQTIGFLNSPTVYQQNESYIQDRWNDFYRPSANGAGVMILYKQLETIYAALPADQQEKSEIFLLAARTVLYDQATQMVDLWGDIPFSEAGSLANAGSIQYPRFDKGEEVYQAAIEELEFINKRLGEIVVDNETRSLFASQDILMGGSIEHWREFVNSLRLRLLMRTSYVNEAYAKNQVTNMLVNSINFPLIGDNHYMAGQDDVLLAPAKTYTDDLHAAFNDWINFPAPYFMLEKVLKPANDLRIPVLFDKYGSIVNNQFVQNPSYNALPLNVSRTDQQSLLTKHAILDSTTFLYNTRLPGIVMTVAEVNFLRAEAFERWGLGDAKTEYAEGIKNSIKFYYYLNNLNTARTKLPPPTDAQIAASVNGEPALQYSGGVSDKLELIATQKWVHFGVLQSVQAWAELRRTNLPKLTFPSSPTGPPNPPSRLTYPLSERTSNPNYGSVSGADSRTVPVFWDVF